METGYTIRKLLKGVPGIPQGPRLFHKKSHGIYTGFGLEQCKSEYCLYYCKKRRLFLIVWVDDLFVFFPKEALPEAKSMWTYLQSKLELDDWEDIGASLICGTYGCGAVVSGFISVCPEFRFIARTNGVITTIWQKSASSGGTC